MCGIFGLTFPKADEIAGAKKSLNTLSHRGPDQVGDFADDKIYFGQRRLSIIDLSENGRQPLVSDDKQILVTVNGEFYGYHKLRDLLIKKYKFHSESDSEVLIYAYKEWGMQKALEKIEGMHASVLYDKEQNKVFLIRDRVGIKPLYYSMIENRVCWASELEAIEDFYGKDNLEVDYTALYDFLTYLYIPTPKTMYKQVFKLPPAHYLEIDLVSGETSLHQYWELKTETKPIDAETAAAEIRNLIDKSVKSQMVADVPVGFFLSGGVDSSVVVATASKFHKHINTYSIGFDDTEHDETHFAAEVAQKFNTNHLRKVVSADWVKDNFQKIYEWYTEPFGDSSAFPTYLVSKFARESSTVALSGDGGDEVFGGYKWYGQQVEFCNNVKHRLFKLVSPTAAKQAEFSNYTKIHAGLTKEQKAEFARMWNIPADYDDYWYFRKYYREDLPLITRLQYLDFHTYLLDDILTKVDRASMAVALEVRVPLLDTDLIEFSFSLPENIRLYHGEPKGIFKLAYKDILPESIISRGKKGFSIPIGKWKQKLFAGDKYIQIAILNRFFSSYVRK